MILYLALSFYVSLQDSLLALCFYVSERNTKITIDYVKHDSDTR